MLVEVELKGFIPTDKSTLSRVFHEIYLPPAVFSP
jgi:hypothetical protein